MTEPYGDGWPMPLVEAGVKRCRCCTECSDAPCVGAMVTGLCDQARCRCDDEPPLDDEYYGDDEP